FIWGGNTNKVDALSYTLSSRIHNEKVVKKSASYVFYYEQGKIKKSDIYKLDAPFIVEIDTTYNQIIKSEIQIEGIDQYSFAMNVIVPEGKVYNYMKDSIIRNETIALPKTARYGQ
ncbi:MAG: capsular biosynthesis protein, partial [Weeksellaceae bacterium]|nr:capsular biosynthesis protein [Weeksellaceae bacterium]